MRCFILYKYGMIVYVYFEVLLTSALFCKGICLYKYGWISVSYLKCHMHEIHSYLIFQLPFSCTEVFHVNMCVSEMFRL